MNTRATNAYSTWARGLFLSCVVALAGCAAPRAVSTVDFGPGAQRQEPATRIAPLPAVVLHEVVASPALNHTAVQYRLLYANAQQLKPYALTRWSMPPAQLFTQRLRDHLALRRPVLAPNDPLPSAMASAGPAAPTWQLRLSLEEFSHLFDNPDTSHVLVRLRATVSQRGTTGDTLVAQRSITITHPASTANAEGGVQALTQASDQAINELTTWLAQVQLAGTGR